jgi:ribonucleoside-triphosphate reductase (formate)
MDLSTISMNLAPAFVRLYNESNPKILDLEGISPKQLDMAHMADLYLNHRVVDISIDDNANANEAKAYGSYLREISQGWYKLLGYHALFQTLCKHVGPERAETLLRASWDGDLYFHDSTSIMTPYCWAYSTSFMLFAGCRWGQLHSLPARHHKTFVDQVKEVTIELAQQLAGAVAIGDFFVNYAYFVKKDQLNPQNPEHRKEIENDFQSLVHTLNKKLRPSYQSPFTNLSIFDRPNIELLFKDMRYPDGSSPDVNLIMDIQKIFCDWFKKGDPLSGLPYRFPVVTLNIRLDDKRQIIDQESFEYFSEINLEKGCFNIYISSGNKVASCCRLTNDLDLAGIDSFGNGGISLGSHRVVTVNLARLGKRAQNTEHLFALLKEQLHNAKELLVAHRQLLRENIAAGLLPLFTQNIIAESRLFSTIGLNGMYECIQEQGHSPFTMAGRVFIEELLTFIKDTIQSISKETGTLFNIEQVPAESLAVKLAAKDKLLYGMDYEIYANQFIPLWVDCDIVDRIKIDGRFSRLLTGGGISHLNIAEKLTHVNQMKRLVAYAIECGCEHFAVNYNFSRCQQGHISVAGQSQFCPVCASPIVDHFTRIIGYFVPVSGWSKGRQEEHAQRVFKQAPSLDHLPHPQVTHKSFETEL